MEFVLAGFVMTFGIIGFIALGFLVGALFMAHGYEKKMEMETDEFEENVRILNETFPANP
jgi:uncharacterized membrane protein YphA (DoxX/SURF4 family)